MKKKSETKAPKTKKPAPARTAPKLTVRKTSQKTSPKRKNVSQTIPNGRTLQTRDERFEGQKNYRKPGYEKKGNYRKVVVVDSNRDDELAVIKLTTSKKGKTLETYQKGKSKYRPFVETKDDEGKPIKAGKKFKMNKPSKDIPPAEISKIKKETFKTARQAPKNRKLVRQIKNDKKGVWGHAPIPFRVRRPRRHKCRSGKNRKLRRALSLYAILRPLSRSFRKIERQTQEKRTQNRFAGSRERYTGTSQNA